MIAKPHAIFAFSILFLTSIASSLHEIETDVIAAPSAYAVTWIDEPVKLIGDLNDLFDGTETVIYRMQNTIDEVPRKLFKPQLETRTP
jgi:hypothetical protein